jgi:hypothetical protein
LGTRAGLVRVFAEEPMPRAICFAARTVTVGRDPSCELSLANIAVSRRHAEIVYSQGSWTLVDGGGRNRTLVNGAPVDRVELRHGDVVRFGDTLYVFVRADADGYAKHDVEQHGDLVGGYRVHRLVQVIERVAPSAIPVRLRGERGSEMTACARLIHERSGRAGELLVIRCTGRDIAQIGAALFGAPADPPRSSGPESPYRRPAETPSAFSSVFFDDIDIAPNTVEWLSRTSARHPRWRFIFGTPAWVEESSLWSYSLGLAPLRERKEDIHAICLDELARLGRREVTCDVSFVAELAARRLEGGSDTLRRLVRQSVGSTDVARLSANHLPEGDPG